LPVPSGDRTLADGTYRIAESQVQIGGAMCEPYTELAIPIQVLLAA
jgi:hypothetical protein